ncbi:MAG: hypothetical protein IT348_19480, partial [Candidatus Eisenbacteria bacterium]|nr:hypothetical protein [Candidatus Eisenbacteria bacterium]
RPFDDNARAARFLAELGAAARDPAISGAGRRAWAAFAKQFDKPRLETAEWALAVRATWADDGPARSTWGEAPPAPPKSAVKKPAPKKKRATGAKRR